MGQQFLLKIILDNSSTVWYHADMPKLCGNKLHEMIPENTTQWGQCRSCKAIHRHEFYIAHQEKEQRRAIRWNRKHPKKATSIYAKWSRTLRGRYNRFRTNARCQGHELNLSFEEFSAIAVLPCFYCGGPLPESGSGIDRIDSDYGYRIDNVRPCCRTCNVAKNAMTEEQFKAWIFQVLKHWACK